MIRIPPSDSVIGAILAEKHGAVQHSVVKIIMARKTPTRLAHRKTVKSASVGHAGEAALGRVRLRCEAPDA